MKKLNLLGDLLVFGAVLAVSLLLGFFTLIGKGFMRVGHYLTTLENPVTNLDWEEPGLKRVELGQSQLL